MLYQKSHGAGKPLYLLHGWALNSRVWDPVVDQLKHQWQVTTIDLPGHGKSSPPTSGTYNIDVLAEEVSCAIDKPATLIGWSLGGMVAQNLAQKYPELVEKLVLVASSPQFAASKDWPCAVKQSVIDGFTRDLIKDYRSTILRFLAIQTLGSEQAKAVVGELREKVFINGEPHLDSLTQGLSILKNTDLRARIQKIHCPTLIIVGEKDTLIPVCSGQQTRSLIRNSQLAIIKGAGHAPFISHTAEFINILEQFLTP